MELRYLGFNQERNRRIYRFDSPVGGKPGPHLLVSVDMSLFLKHHVGIQEGPSLCALKLTADLESDRQGEHELTNDDLLAYAAGKAAAQARKAETRRPGPIRHKPEAGQPVSPWRR